MHTRNSRSSSVYRLKFSKLKVFHAITIRINAFSHSTFYCATSRKVSGSISSGVAGDFLPRLPTEPCALGVDSASKNEYQKNSWGRRRPVRKDDDLTTFIVPKVEKIQEP